MTTLSRRRTQLLGLLLLAGCNASPTMEKDGGVRLVYEIDQSIVPAHMREDLTPEQVAERAQRRLEGVYRGVHAEAVGDTQIQIDIPGIEKSELTEIKKMLSINALFELLIVANNRDDEALIETARASDEEIVLNEDGDQIGWWVVVRASDNVNSPATREDTLRARTKGGAWVPVMVDENGKPKPLIGNSNSLPEVDEGEPSEDELTDLQMLLRVPPIARNRITGQHVSRAHAGLDHIGHPSVSFYMTETGGVLLKALTSRNLPDDDTNFARRMAMVLNDEVVSAPFLRGVISDRGEITGDFTQAEVDDLVNVLNTGQSFLPLNPKPDKENWIDPK